MFCLKNSLLTEYLSYLQSSIREKESISFLGLLEKNPDAYLLDCGCGPGSFTLQIANRLETNKIMGIDSIQKRVSKAEAKGIKVYLSDLNNRFPIDDESVDVITAHHVIEHLVNIDNFAREVHRVLKPAGYAVIATENLASIHNIFALVCGFQPFTMASMSENGRIGNPLASIPLRNEFYDLQLGHIKVFAFKAFIDLFKIHGFQIQRIIAVGYYPFPPMIANILCQIDPRHAHSLIIRIQKQRC